MSEATLDIKLTLKSSESTLRDIHTQLTSVDDGDAPALGDELTAAVRQILREMGVVDMDDDDFDIILHCGSIVKPLPSKGGLNSREWMETNTPPQDLTAPKGVGVDYSD